MDNLRKKFPTYPMCTLPDSSRESRRVLERVYLSPQWNPSFLQSPFVLFALAVIKITGYQIFHNYIKPHEGLEGKTPAEACGIEVKVENSPVKISTPEKTIVDCLDHPEHCGGIEEVAKAIYFEHKNLDFEKIVDMVKKMGNRTIIKRLGYLLEKLGLHEYDNLLTGLKISKGYSCLDPKLPKKGKINERWKLRVNIKIDPEQWAR